MPPFYKERGLGSLLIELPDDVACQIVNKKGPRRRAHAEQHMFLGSGVENRGLAASNCLY